MNTKHRTTVLLAILMALLNAKPMLAQQSQLEAALGDMYAACLFEGLGPNNPFSRAVDLARLALAPGFSSFAESNLASIPLAPPSLDAVFANGQIVTTVTGFTPIFTESSATVGKGQILVGSNVSYFDLTRIRGQELSDMFFAFEQNGGGDVILVNMPLEIDATVFSLYGTYGVTDRLDIGIALPIVRLSIENKGTTFRVEGNDSGCRYDVGEGGQGLNCNGVGARDITVDLNNFGGEFQSETYLNALTMRAKYRFPFTSSSGSVASVLDMRIPVGRSEENIMGKGNFGASLTFIGEYDGLGRFKPYINLGGQYWSGDQSSSLKVAVGFNQQLASKLFFTFDLLSEIDLESDPFLSSIDNTFTPDFDLTELSLASSSIPTIKREHTLNTALGLQVALSPRFHAYGSALFALLDRGLQAAVAPTAGVALSF